MTKLEKTRKLIRDGYRTFPSSLVCWSGGKDSMALLHIMRSMGINLPVIFFREPWQPQKYEFHDKLIRDWQLTVYSWHPQESAFQQADDEFEVQNAYQLNTTLLTCPTGIVEPVEGLPWVCALDIANRPKQRALEMQHFQALWIGHKGCDSDPILGGDAGTRIEARFVPGQSTMLFPLRDWTHADVWEYLESNNVPYDEQRYEKTAEGWGEKADKRHNVDYVHACTRCLDRRQNAAKFVSCPKLGMTVENISNLVPWAVQEKISYMKD
jgi:3'-phosphoadenosine 5'-phosphosulfate sulfotransferase (PAPS reductase)/FAD synthetase